MKQGKTDIRELAAAIQDEANNKKDYVTPSQRLNIKANGDLKVEMKSEAGDNLENPLTPIASRQIGEKIGIPAK